MDSNCISANQTRLDLLVELNQITPKIREIAKHGLSFCSQWLGIDIDQLDSSMFITHLAVTLQRIDMHEGLPIPPDVIKEEIQSKQELYEFSRELCLKLSKDLGQDIPESEWIYIAAHLGALRIQANDQEKVVH